MHNLIQPLSMITFVVSIAMTVMVWVYFFSTAFWPEHPTTKTIEETFKWPLLSLATGKVLLAALVASLIMYYGRNRTAGYKDLFASVWPVQAAPGF